MPASASRPVAKIAACRNSAKASESVVQISTALRRNIVAQRGRHRSSAATQNTSAIPNQYSHTTSTLLIHNACTTVIPYAYTESSAEGAPSTNLHVQPSLPLLWGPNSRDSPPPATPPPNFDIPVLPHAEQPQLQRAVQSQQRMIYTSLLKMHCPYTVT